MNYLIYLVDWLTIPFTSGTAARVVPCPVISRRRIRSLPARSVVRMSNKVISRPSRKESTELNDHYLLRHLLASVLSESTTTNINSQFEYFVDWRSECPCPTAWVYWTCRSLTSAPLTSIRHLRRLEEVDDFVAVFLFWTATYWDFQ